MWPDSLLLVPLIFGLGFWTYTRRQEGDSAQVKVLSAANGVVHSVVLLPSALLFSWLNQGLPDFCGWHLPAIAVFLLEMTMVGTLIGGSLFGLYLYVSSKRFNINHNDAFSSMRLDSYRNFLRMRIKDDEVKIYPIGLTKIPKREDWRINTGKEDSPPPAYVPATPLAPHLIEGPIVISTGTLL